MAITLTGTGSRVHPDGMSPDPEVPEKGQRRRYITAYKLRILEEADRATEPGSAPATRRHARTPRQARAGPVTALGFVGKGADPNQGGDRY